MKMLLPLLLAATLFVPAPPPAVPECTATLTLPDSAQKLELRWRQIPDEPAFHEGEGLDAQGLRAFRESHGHAIRIGDAVRRALGRALDASGVETG